MSGGSGRRSSVPGSGYDTGTGTGGYTGGTARASGRKSSLPDWYRRLSLIMLILSMCLMVFAGMAITSGNGSKTREKLPQSACISSDRWIDDQVNWLADTGKVKKAMQNFYDKTGVQPYLLICSSLDGKGGEITDAEAETALADLYNSLYQDEGHMIFAFMEYETSQYITWIYTGRSADAVIDADARGVILDNADRYYSDSSLSDEEFFTKIFEKSADMIMKDGAAGVKTAVTYVVLSVVILILMAAGLILFKLREQRMKEREQLQEILNTPIQGSAEEEELKRKYGES